MKFQNLYKYLKQRFPIINMVLFAILFLTVYSVARFFIPHKTINLNPLDFLGILACIFFFFRLRVFDEIKDYDIDVINHPGRILQSGQITLKELQAIALLGTFIEIAWSISMGMRPFLAWLAAFTFSLFMRYEFFIPGFLKKRLLVYAISHMLIMPLIILWVWTAYSPITNSGYYLLALLSLLGGFSFELARKIHSPDAEKTTVDSYSKSMGFIASIAAVLGVLGVGIAVLSYLLFIISASIWSFLIIGLLYFATIILYLLILNKPQEKWLPVAEILVSLFMLISYLSVIIEINFRQ